MANFTETILENIPKDIFTTDVLKNVLNGSPDHRYGIIKRALADGKIIHVKRGIYALPKKYHRQGINLFELAQYIYGPSYISMESALAHHGWIPEAVYAVTSAGAKNARQFTTPYGIFVYKRVPYPILYLGVDRVQEGDKVYFMANPVKALADYVYVYRKDWRSIDPLIKDLRIDDQTLRHIDRPLLDQLIETYSNYRVRRFLKSLKKETAA